MALVTVSHSMETLGCTKCPRYQWGREEARAWDGPKLAPVGIGDTTISLCNLAMEEQREIALQRGEGG